MKNIVYFETPISLEDLEKFSKKRDKSLNKIIRNRTDLKQKNKNEIKEKNTKKAIEKKTKEIETKLISFKNSIAEDIKNLSVNDIKITKQQNTYIASLPKQLEFKIKKLHSIINYSSKEVLMSLIEKVLKTKLDEKIFENYNNLSALFKKVKVMLLETIDSDRETNSNNDNFKYKFKLEDNETRRIHFVQGVPDYLRNMGLGKKLYKAIGKKLKIITSEKNATDDAKKIWVSLLISDKNFYSFYNSNTSMRGIISKDTPVKVINNFFRKILNEKVYILPQSEEKKYLHKVAAISISKEMGFSETNQIDELFKQVQEKYKSESQEKIKSIKKIINKKKDKIIEKDGKKLFYNTSKLGKIYRKVVFDEWLSESVVDKDLVNIVKDFFTY